MAVEVKGPLTLAQVLKETPLTIYVQSEDPHAKAVGEFLNVNGCPVEFLGSPFARTGEGAIAIFSSEGEYGGKFLRIRSPEAREGFFEYRKIKVPLWASGASWQIAIRTYSLSDLMNLEHEMGQKFHHALTQIALAFPHNTVARKERRKRVRVPRHVARERGIDREELLFG